MENKFNYSRLLKTKKAAKAFVRTYLLTDYEIKNTSFKREYQGRIATSSQYTVYYNTP